MEATLQRQARILLIDDDEVDFVITRKLLGKLPDHRYELDWVDTYEGGLQAVASDRYDVCLVDYQLGPQTGLDLLREVRARGSELPMIILTARSDERIDAEAFALGAAGFIDKARLDSEELDRSLRYALRREGLVNDLVKHNAELLHMHRLTELFLERNSLQEACGEVVHEIARFTGFPMIAIERHDEARGTLEPLGVMGTQARGEAVEPEVPIHRSSTARVLDTHAPWVEMECTTADRDGLKHLDWVWVQSAMSLPIIVGGQVTGVLTLAHSEAHVLDSSQVNLAAGLASHVGRLIGRLHDPAYARTGPPQQGDSEAARTVEQLVRLHAWALSEAGRRGVALRWETLASVPPATDADELFEVVGSLLESALASSRAGTVGVRLFPVDDPSRVEVSLELPSDERERKEAVSAGTHLVEMLEGTQTIADDTGVERMQLKVRLRG